MRKNKVNACELATRNEYTNSSEGHMMGQDNPLDSSNVAVDKDNRFFKIKLETDATIKYLATLTVYNWQSADATDSLTFPAASHMWNSIRYANDNGKSSAFYCHLIQSNSDAGYIPVDIGLMNNINDETTTLWQTITKAFASTMSDTKVEVGDDIAGNFNSIQLNPTQQGMEFLLTLSNDMQPLTRIQQLDFIRHELGMSISRLTLAT